MEFEDLLEARELEMASFQPSSRNTAADQSGDMRTAERRLDKMLYLLVKKNRASHCWQVPQGGLEEGETLLQVKFNCATTVVYIVVWIMSRVQRGGYCRRVGLG